MDRDPERVAEEFRRKVADMKAAIDEKRAEIEKIRRLRKEGESEEKKLASSLQKLERDLKEAHQELEDTLRGR